MLSRLCIFLKMNKKEKEKNKKINKKSKTNSERKKYQSNGALIIKI